MQVTFSKPLPAEELNLVQAKKDFVFDRGMTICNVPQLKTGSTSTYIIPTTLQEPGKMYTLSYKGQKALTFQASTEKIQLGKAHQVSYDTFEIDTDVHKGTVDYSYIIAAESGWHGKLDFALDENNR